MKISRGSFFVPDQFALDSLVVKVMSASLSKYILALSSISSQILVDHENVLVIFVACAVKKKLKLTDFCMIMHCWLVFFKVYLKALP